MKKILFTVLFLCLATVCSACLPIGAPGGQQGQLGTPVSSEGFPRDFKSLTEAFENAGYVLPDQRFAVLSDVIGADAGCRYVSSLGDNKMFYIELYYYDPEKVSEKAQQTIDEVNSDDGCFTVMGKQVSAIMSDNGKYMMVYGDAQTDQESTDRRGEVISMFKSFQ